MIAIIGLLIALLLPAVQSARRLQCANNLEQLGGPPIPPDSEERARGRMPR